jgi:hypothetical protein
VLVSQPRDFNPRIYALIALDCVCYVVLGRQDYAYWIPPEFQIHLGAAAPLLDIGRNFLESTSLLINRRARLIA